MSEPDPWTYVTRGRYQEAIEAYAQIPAAMTTSIVLANRAAAYLCVRDYDAAARDYGELIQVDPKSARGYSGLAVCHWCRRQPRDAIRLWRQGLSALYTDVAGVSIPGRLLYAGVRLHDTAIVREAQDLLRRRMRRKTIGAWPGELAPFVLGKVTTADFEAAARIGVTSDVLLQRHLCQYHFYLGVHGAISNDVEEFEHSMRACAGSGYGYLEHEYYLATWEVDQQFPNLIGN